MSDERRASIPLAGVMNATKSSFPRLDIDGLTARVATLEEANRKLVERVAALEGKAKA